MSEKYSELAKEMVLKIKNDEKQYFIIPLATVKKNIAIVQNMSYKELADRNKKLSRKVLEMAYADQRNAGKNSEEAKKASVEILKVKMDEYRQVIIGRLHAKEKEIEESYQGFLKGDINKLEVILHKWDIRKEMKTAPDIEFATKMAKIYVTAYNCLGKEKKEIKDILFYFPVIEQKNNSLKITIRDNFKTRYYNTDFFNAVQITDKGFIFIASEYTNNFDKKGEITPLTEEEQLDASILNNISPKDFKFKMFVSPITKHRIIDRCKVSYCHYSKGHESAAGIQVLYKGDGALKKFFEVCQEMFSSDAFRKILNETSVFLTSDFVNYKDILKKRIK